MAVEAELGLFAPVWFAAAAVVGIAIGFVVAAAGWLAAARRRGQRERHGRRSTAERLPPRAEPEPVGGAAAAGPGEAQQAGREQQLEEGEERGQ